MARTRPWAFGSAAARRVAALWPAVLAAALAAAAVDGGPACFPGGGPWSLERCCWGGGLADCFSGEFSFAACCPAHLRGADPAACFEDAFAEEVCCAGAGLAQCFGGAFTRRACCYSQWSGQADPVIAALQRAEEMGEAMVLGHRFPEKRGTYFGYLFVQLNLSGPGLEIGVKQGDFAADFLRTVSTLGAMADLPRYFLVDVWREVPAAENYVDTANVENSLQRENLKASIDNVAEFWQRVSLVQLRSTEAARIFRDGSLAFVYLDARHDYCAVYEELTLYWPKVSPGGVLAGDDCYAVGGRWEVCETGVRHAGGAYRAVSDFAEERGLQWRKLHNQFVLVKPRWSTPNG